MKRISVLLIFILVFSTFIFAGCTQYGHNNLLLNERYYLSDFTDNQYKKDEVNYIIFENNCNGRIYKRVETNNFDGNGNRVYVVASTNFVYTIVDESSIAITYKPYDTFYVETGKRVNNLSEKIKTEIVAVSENVIMFATGSVYTNEKYLKQNGYIN